MSKKILEDVATENALAVKLRAALTPSDSSPAPNKVYADDPCRYLTTEPVSNSEPVLRTATGIEELQQFAAVIRELHSRAIKLNNMISVPFAATLECDPFLGTQVRGCPAGPKPEDAEAQLQLNPAIMNYTAEVLCKIRAFQRVRTFANNVQADYAAAVGAVTSYAFPILYALLGAYAFRLRLFGETVRKRTFHPSYADSARMITAIIAGAISGLFNPAQGMSLSPLAVAFLVGYGVELFFKLLDTLTNAFGSPSITATRSTK
jgi:hypothetical protein